MNRNVLVIGLILGMAALTSWSAATEEHAGQPAAAVGMPMCPVMDEPVNFTVSVRTDDGPVFFCCGDCVTKYQADPGKYAEKVKGQRAMLAARPKAQVVCPVSGEPVDMKVSAEHNGQQVYFCCPKCVAKFTAEPDKYKAGLANAYSYQTKCPVMGETIDPKSFTVLPTGQKIYFCCQKCEGKLLGDPAKYNKSLVEQGVLIDWTKVQAKGKESGHDHHGHDHHGHEGHDH